MKYQFYIALLLSLISLTMNDFPDLILYSHRTLNSGTKNEIVELTTGTNSLIIYSKYEKSSKIIIELSPKNSINESLIYYDKVKKNDSLVYIPDKKYRPTIASTGNKYTCTYSVSEGDGYKYGVLIIDKLSSPITVSVNVISDTTFWIAIVVIIIVLILLLVGIFVICKKCYRCMFCSS